MAALPAVRLHGEVWARVDCREHTRPTKQESAALCSDPIANPQVRASQGSR